MCEIHTNRCPRCKTLWKQRHKLPLSCDQPDDPLDQCAEWLCMYVGNPRRPAKLECKACKDEMEVRASWREFGEDFEPDAGNEAEGSGNGKNERREQQSQGVSTPEEVVSAAARSKGAQGANGGDTGAEGHETGEETAALAPAAVCTGFGRGWETENGSILHASIGKRTPAPCAEGPQAKRRRVCPVTAGVTEKAMGE